MWPPKLTLFFSAIVPSTPSLPHSVTLISLFMLQVSTSTSLLSVLRCRCPTAAAGRRRRPRSSPRRDARRGSTAATRGFDNSGTISLSPLAKRALYFT